MKVPYRSCVDVINFMHNSITFTLNPWIITVILGSHTFGEKFLCILVQSLSRAQLFATPRTAAGQACLSITSCQSLLRLMSIESVVPSSHLILCRPLLLLPQSFPASGSFQMNQFLTSGGQSVGVSASATVLPMNIQDWCPLGWTGWISLQSKGLSRVFSNTTVQNLWDQYFANIVALDLW